MAAVPNVAARERVIRTIAGGILVVGGFLLPGIWKPLSIVLGLCLLFTAFDAY
jgi:hypothetical protein